MPQFFVPKKQIHQHIFYLDETESHHLVVVLRKKVGDIFRIFDGEGSVYEAKITNLSNPKQVQGEMIVSEVLPPRSPSPSHQRRVHLYPALFKSPRFEWMIEKGTELGVCSIHPVVTERTIITVDHKIETKLDRWNKTILAAAKQCGSPSLPTIHKPSSFLESIQNLDHSIPSFILWEREEQVFLSQALREKKEAQEINLFFGPEGGLTLKEVEAATASGIQPVRLGNNILRVETAIIAASTLSLLQ